MALIVLVRIPTVALLLLVANVGAQLMVISQSDGSLKFILPPAFNASIRHHSCDAQWDVDVS